MIKAVKEALPTMMALARERTELSRIQLAGMLADIFLHNDGDLTLREEEMVNELIDQLMHNSTPVVRAQLIEKFIDVSRMPRRMASTMVKIAPEVAHPILLTNPYLTDGDLVQIIEDRNTDHAVAIAMRKSVNEAVADALVLTGDVHVMKAVAENLGAHLSVRAVDIVADAARYSAELRKPLFSRPEMRADVALKLYWWIEQDLRRSALKRFEITAGQIDEALAKTISTFLDSHVHEKNNDEVMEQIAEWMESHQAITVQVLPQVLRMGHFRLFNMLLARISNLTLSLIDSIMGEAGGRGLAAICRASEIDKPSFVSLFLLSRGGRQGDQIVHPRELSVALAAFDRMSPAIARDLLHSWGLNPEHYAKHQQEAAAEELAGF